MSDPWREIRQACEVPDNEAVIPHVKRLRAEVSRLTEENRRLLLALNRIAARGHTDEVRAALKGHDDEQQ